MDSYLAQKSPGRGPRERGDTAYWHDHFELPFLEGSEADRQSMLTHAHLIQALSG